jgi:hypothetical protein
MNDHQHHPRSIRDNLRQPMPIWRKVRLICSNSLIKLWTRRGCCGNYGQPGC